MEYVFIFAFLLNLVWEYGHLPMYDCMDRWNLPRKILYPFFASLADLVVVVGILYGAGWISGVVGAGLATTGFWAIHLLTALLIAVFLEWVAIRTRLWGYKTSMRTFTITGQSVGLSPLLQITLTPSLSLYLGLLLI